MSDEEPEVELITVCDYCQVPATGTFTYDDDPDFEYYVCDDCPLFDEEGNEIA